MSGRECELLAPCPGQLGRVEIESRWTASRRGNQLPEHLRYTEKNPIEVWGISGLQRATRSTARSSQQRDERGTPCILDPGSEDEESVPGPPADERKRV